MPSYPDCRAKPVSADTPPWCHASWRRSGLSAHSRRGPLRRVADGSGPKTQLSHHRLTIAGQRGVVRSRDRGVDWVGQVCTFPGLTGGRHGLDLEESSKYSPPRAFRRRSAAGGRQAHAVPPSGGSLGLYGLPRRRMAARTPSSCGRTPRCTRDQRVGRQTQLDLYRA